MNPKESKNLRLNIFFFNSSRFFLFLSLLLLSIINKVNSIYYKLEHDNEKCFLDDINKGSVKNFI